MQTVIMMKVNKGFNKKEGESITLLFRNRFRKG